MENIRSGNLSVANMQSEIVKSMSALKKKYLHKRAMRQLLDGDKLIAKAPYNRCKTVGELKNTISQERNHLKNVLKDMDKYTPSYQLSLFETYEQPSKRELELIEKEQLRLQEEIRWLHKCLGICSNRQYFG